MDDSEEEEEEEEEDDSEEADGSEEEADGGAGDRAANATAELLEHDMGLGLPFRDGAFDGAVSVSALQWLCYDNDAASSAPRRLNRFFASLYRCLRAGGRAALSSTPRTTRRRRSSRRPRSARASPAASWSTSRGRPRRASATACLSTERRYRAPDARDAAGAPRRRGGGRKRGRDWVLDKKAHQRKKGGRVRPDSKFTGRKRKDKF